MIPMTRTPFYVMQVQTAGANISGKLIIAQRGLLAGEAQAGNIAAAAPKKDPAESEVRVENRQIFRGMRYLLIASQRPLIRSIPAVAP